MTIGSHQTSTAPDGSYAFADVEHGSWHVEITHPGFLRVAIEIEVVADGVAIPSHRVLYAGDANQDGRIDAEDTGLVADAMRHAPTQEAWYRDRDFTGDGLVDVLDLVAVQYNLGRSSTMPIEATARSLLRPGRRASLQALTCGWRDGQGQCEEELQ